MKTVHVKKSNMINTLTIFVEGITIVCSIASIANAATNIKNNYKESHDPKALKRAAKSNKTNKK